MTDHTPLTDAEREWLTQPLPSGTSTRELAAPQAAALAERAERIVAARVAEARAEFAAECIRSIEAMATASQYGPHRRAGMRDAAHRVERIAREGADR